MVHYYFLDEIEQVQDQVQRMYFFGVQLRQFKVFY